MHFKEKMNNIFQHLLVSKSARRDVSDVHIRSVFFGDYMTPVVEDGPLDRLYDEITDMGGMVKDFDNPAPMSSGKYEETLLWNFPIARLN